MTGLARVLIAVKALSQLGPARLAENGLYRLGLALDWWKTPLPSVRGGNFGLNLEALPLFTVETQKQPQRHRDTEVFEKSGAAQQNSGYEALFLEAQEVVDGKVRLFGQEQAQPLILNPLISQEDKSREADLIPQPPSLGSVAELGAPSALTPLPPSPEAGRGGSIPTETAFPPHPVSREGGRGMKAGSSGRSILPPWQAYERGSVHWPGEDIKFGWEPARFGWAVTLARAYRASGDERFSRAFWSGLEAFQEGNPAYLGPNWTSGQEAALRIITWGSVLRALAGSAESSPARMQALAQAIALHAERIPPTLIYARSQDNNHLLSEAAGLYTAGLLLPEHPRAAAWRRQGWTWFNRAVQRQVDAQGTYTQQSVNYHRMLLQLSLWVDALAQRHGDAWPAASRERLAAAARWLWARLDPASGRAPNLGHNDGSHLFPFGAYSNQRATVQAAGRAFLGQELLAAGPWDELSRWLGLEIAKPAAGAMHPAWPEVYRDTGGVVLRAAHSWAALRAAPLHSRPGQADQLQVDLWRDGVNVLLDAGTYRYNAAPPWDNGLASGAVHNGVVIDGREPMTRGGRFLWLDWDKAVILSCIPGCATAERSGYRRLGVRHKRTLECQRGESWLVTDELLATGARGVRSQHEFTLRWLLPDGEWQLEGTALRLTLPGFQVSVQVDCQASPAPQPAVYLVRAGELLAGQAADVEKLGWVSPTYGMREPALTLGVRVQSRLPLKLRTSIQFSAP